MASRGIVLGRGDAGVAAQPIEGLIAIPCIEQDRSKRALDAAHAPEGAQIMRQIVEVAACANRDYQRAVSGDGGEPAREPPGWIGRTLQLGGQGRGQRGRQRCGLPVCRCCSRGGERDG